MRNMMLLSLVLVLLWNLGGCAKGTTEDKSPSQTIWEEPNTLPEETETEAAENVPTVPETEAETVTEPEAPSHSSLYLPEYTTQQVWEYFSEVVLNVEYTDGTGDATLVQKWLAPIRYRICGTPTDEDMAVLNTLFAELNTVPGFPGIHAADEGEIAGITINFLDRGSFNGLFSEILHGEYANGATQFWYYTETNEIYTANIGYCMDIEQEMRSSILLEEIINTLGISDTILRPDSIVYQYSDENTALSEVDWLILKLLYDPAIQCGMNAEACAAVIETLYY